MTTNILSAKPSVCQASTANSAFTDSKSTLSAPTVSIIIPVYNGEAFIQAALDTVFAQTFNDYEIIVVDDGSTDATMAILEAYGDRLQIVRQKNGGHASARNAATNIARGEWIAMLDADDLWHPNKLEQQLATAGDADVVYTAALNFEDSKRVDDVTFRDGECPRGDIFEDLIIDNFITHSSVLIRKSALVAVGGYDETLKTTCDWDLWLRMSAAGSRFAGLQQPLTEYRWRATSNSKNHDRTCQDRLNVLQKALDTPRGHQVSVLQRRKAIARVWQTSAWFVAEKDDRTALNWYLHSIIYRPYSIRGWKEVTRCLLHLCGISRQKLRSAFGREVQG